MLEVVSAVALAVEGTSICIDVSKRLKIMLEAAKNARQDLLDLMGQVDGFRNSFELLRVATAELQQTDLRGMSLAIDEGKCQNLLGELTQLAGKIVGRRSSLGISERFQWARRLSTAEDLLDRIAKQRGEINNALTIITATSALRTQRHIDSLIAQAELNPRPKVAFDNIKLNEYAIKEHEQDGSNPSPRLRTWLGHITTESHPEHYLEWRDKLSNASYIGDWEGVMEAIEVGQRDYQEQWANAPRMKSLQEVTNISMWTPLHQAVYNFASLEDVQNLIAAGASRILRTRRSEFTYADTTPLELAYELKATHLYDILAPVVQNPIPKETLNAIQERLHSLICEDIGDRVDTEKIFLPVLEVMTEFRSEPLWFPVKFTGERISGYLIQLDGRELVVGAINMNIGEPVRTLRISASGVEEVEQAILS